MTTKDQVLEWSTALTQIRRDVRPYVGALDADELTSMICEKLARIEQANRLHKDISGWPTPDTAEPDRTRMQLAAIHRAAKRWAAGMSAQAEREEAHRWLAAQAIASELAIDSPIALDDRGHTSSFPGRDDWLDLIRDTFALLGPDLDPRIDGVEVKPSPWVSRSREQLDRLTPGQRGTIERFCAGTVKRSNSNLCKAFWLLYDFAVAAEVDAIRNHDGPGAIKPPSLSMGSY